MLNSVSCHCVFAILIALNITINAFTTNSTNSTIEWTEIDIPMQSSMIVSNDMSSDQMIVCGGQIESSLTIGSTTTSTSCSIMTIEENNDEFEVSTSKTYASGRVKVNMIIYPSIYQNIDGISTQTSNTGAYDSATERLCMIGMDYGSNKPPCWCCNVNRNQIKCETISGPTVCPSRIDSCVVHDKSLNVMYQIGGYYGNQIYDTILCFDVKTESFVYGSDNCPFGSLTTPLFDVGCAVLPDSSIVVIGGIDTFSTSTNTNYVKSIQICKANANDCESLDLELDFGVLETRILVIDQCHIAVIGGTMKKEGSSSFSDNIDIAYICDGNNGPEWLEYFDLLKPLAQFGILQLNGVFCIYGGHSYDNSGYPILNDKAYCARIENTLSPTNDYSVFPTKSPSDYPTKMPTNAPSTDIPTIVPTTVPTVVPTMQTIEAIRNCEMIDVNTRDFSFKSIYYRQNGIYETPNAKYYIYDTADKQSSLILEANGFDKTWIYNFTENTKCFYNGNEAPPLGPGMWTRPRTRYSQTHNVFITMTCNDNGQDSFISENGSDAFGILSENAFISIVVVGGAIFIGLLASITVCCYRKSHSYAISEGYATNTTKDSDDEQESTNTKPRLKHERVRSHSDKLGDVDMEESRSTVPECQVKFNDSHKMFEKVEFEMNNELEIEKLRLNQMTELSHVRHKQSLESINTPSLLPLQLECPPPPPPIQATMFVKYDSSNSDDIELI